MGAQAAVFVVAAGLVGAQLTPWRLPPVTALVGGAIVLLAWGLWRRPVLGCLGVAAWAAALGAQRVALVERPILPSHHVARLALPARVTLEGEVETIRRGRGGRTVLVLRARTVRRAGAIRRVTGRVRLTVRTGMPKLRSGDGIRADTTLRAPRSFGNPGSFDLVAHLARRDIHVTAALWEGSRLERLPRPTRDLATRLRRWRERLGRTIARSVPMPRAAVVEALVLGNDDRIPESLRLAFTRAGVVHVLSVSGLHIGLVAVAGFGTLRWLLGRSERLLLVLDVRRAAAVLALGPAALYGVLAGLETATLRAVVMAAAGVGALLLARGAHVLRLLALAAITLAIVQPGAPREIGFQLSFVSVLALVIGARRWPGRPGPRGWLARALVVSASALAGTAPLTALHFQQVSLMGVVANPLIIPLFGSPVIVLGLVGALLEPFSAGAAALCFHLTGEAVRPGLALVDSLARPAWAALATPAPSGLELVLLYAGLAAVVAPAGRVRRAIALAVLVGLVADTAWWIRARWAPGVLRATFLDVGQGDAAVVELPDGRVLVVDAGGFPGSDFDTGAAIVAPYLATRKIAHLDALVMTHAHPDHAGGLASLVRRYAPREFWWTGAAGRGATWDDLARALGDGVTARRVLRSDGSPASWATGVAVLHPPGRWPRESLNDGSLTLRVTHGRVSVLLTGDVEALGESRLLRGPGVLQAAVLKVPHHGSRTSSTPAFVAAVAPAIAVISVGADNRYRLPAPEVERRYRNRGTCVLRTDRCGAVTIVSDGATLDVTAMRPGCICP